ncbi:nucleotide exchange factor GrpE [Candidatus Woesearchaeota archaeon]|nr:nucleotide exchange factor GrpE [Candidatus Woesearchaeota archaeon]
MEKEEPLDQIKESIEKVKAESKEHKKHHEQKKKTKTDELEQQLKQKVIQIEELTDTLKRVQAEFVNYKNRNERESENFREYAKESLVKNLLPILDSFEHALRQKDKAEEFVKGIELIYAQFSGILKQEGLSPINSLGEKFDPYMHEVMLKEKSDKEPDTVIEELQKGYLFKGKVLRHTKVKISE